MRKILAAAFTGLMSIGSAHALTITQSTTFGSGAALLTWSDFAPGPYTAGTVPPFVGGGNFTDGDGDSVAGNISFGNWIDGPGFDYGATAVADLALNGSEDFTLNFATPVRGIALAISTGTGNLLSEVRQNGAIFNITAGADSGTLMLGPGGYTRWVTITSATPFSSISFTEAPVPGFEGDLIYDQYFGDVVSAAVPEPDQWALLIGGFGLAGAALRRKRRTLAAA